MAAGFHTFTTCDVFAAERFQGNRLAIVAVRSNSLCAVRKLAITREFGYSETVFIHDSPGPGIPRRLEIYTKDGEVPFAGHPVIGVGSYFFTYIEPKKFYREGDREDRLSTVFMTKAGPITVYYNPYRLVCACVVPQTYHVHQKGISLQDVIRVQPQLGSMAIPDRLNAKIFPVVSIVRGMTFSLVDLTGSPDVLAALKAGDAPKATLDEVWEGGLVGCLYYELLQREVKGVEPPIQKIHQRMIVAGIEDPGTGSASCALACYLALTRPWEKQDEIELKKEDETTDKSNDGKDDQKDGKNTVETTEGSAISDTITEKTESLTLGPKKERFVFGIEQGAEMQRQCQICVEVDVAEDEQGKRSISSVILSGRSVMVFRGEILGIY